MKNLVIAILVFCAFVGAVYSLKCYQCGSVSEYTCERGVKDIICPEGNYTCYKIHGSTTSGKEWEARGCLKKTECKSLETLCDFGTEEQKKAKGFKECTASCCVSDGDNPCNGGKSRHDDNDDNNFRGWKLTKCYSCFNEQKGVEYTTEQCEKDQKVMDCPVSHKSNGVLYALCSKMHATTTEGVEKELRGCMPKTNCEQSKKLCEEGTEEKKKAKGIKECEIACCVSDGDKPCNGGFTVSINMFMIMFAVLCSLKLF